MPWDNGIGLNEEGLKNWAKMGHHSEACKLNPTDYWILLTSCFSRYGVGGKKALFNLGDAFQVRTIFNDKLHSHDLFIEI